MSAVQDQPAAPSSGELVATGGPRAALLASTQRWPVAWATLIGSVGVAVQTVGYALGWADDRTPALLLWYAGFALVVAPFAALLLAPTRTDHQRLGGSLAFTLLLYASWLFYSPVLAIRFDETLHVSTLVSLTEGRGLFTPNPTLPVSPHFPGLELAAGGLHWVSGMPLMAAQVLVVVAARSTFVLALFLLASRIGRSTRVGSVTVVLYCASPQFYFFNAQFSYQTLAIALMVAALYLLVRAFDDPARLPWRPMLAAQVCLVALALTHHVTSALTLALLWVLAVAFRLGGEQRRHRLTLVTAEIFTVVLLAWVAVVAPLLIGYFGPVFSSAAQELWTAFEGGGGREVGVSQGGEPAPTWQLLVMAGSILLWIAMLLPAAWRALRGETVGASRGRLVLLGVAMLYPVLQLGRFSSTAGELSDRLSTFVAMAMALVVGAWAVPRLHVIGRLVIPAGLVLVLGGTILGGGPDWQRVPGPYLAGAEQRSIDARSVAVAQWAQRYLPRDSRIASDFTLGRLLPDFAPVTTVTFPGGLTSVTPIFLASTVDATVVSTITDYEIDFVIVDERMIDQRIRSGSYYEGSAGYGEEAMELSAQQLTKFRDAPGFEEVLDGPVTVYDVRSLRGAPSTWADREPGGLPGDMSRWQLVVAGLLLAAGVSLRGRLLDPRRFRARDLWRVAVVLPGCMVLGLLGVLTGFSTAAGSVTAALVVAGLVGASARPGRLATSTPRTATLAWAAVIFLVLLAALALALWAAWHGLAEAPALPPPIGSGIAP